MAIQWQWAPHHRYSRTLERFGFGGGDGSDELGGIRACEGTTMNVAMNATESTEPARCAAYWNYVPHCRKYHAFGSCLWLRVSALELGSTLYCYCNSHPTKRIWNVACDAFVCFEHSGCLCFSLSHVCLCFDSTA